MVERIAGYEILEELYQSPKSFILKAVRAVDQQAVVIKTLNSKYPTPQEIARLQREYQLTQSLRHLPGVIKIYALERQIVKEW